MPCYYTGTKEGDALLATEESAKQLQRKVTKLTRICCDLAYGRSYNDQSLSLQTRSWIKRHRKLDKKRRSK